MEQRFKPGDTIVNDEMSNKDPAKYLKIVESNSKDHWILLDGAGNLYIWTVDITKDQVLPGYRYATPTELVLYFKQPNEVPGNIELDEHGNVYINNTEAYIP